MHCRKHQHVLNDLAFIHRGLICLSPNPFRVTAEKNNKQLSVFFCLTRDIPAKAREVFRPARRNRRPVSSPAERGVPHLSAQFWEPMTVPSLQIKKGCIVCRAFSSWPLVSGILSHTYSHIFLWVTAVKIGDLSFRAKGRLLTLLKSCRLLIPAQHWALFFHYHEDEERNWNYLARYWTVINRDESAATLWLIWLPRNQTTCIVSFHVLQMYSCLFPCRWVSKEWIIYPGKTRGIIMCVCACIFNLNIIAWLLHICVLPSSACVHRSRHRALFVHEIALITQLPVWVTNKNTNHR